MRFGTILKLAGLGALALIVALVAVVKSIDVNNYRDVLTQAAKSATGRDLSIRGKFSLRLSLTPALIAEDVTLANAAWGSRPEMIRLQRLRADISLLPLLVREVRISRLQLIGPDVLLERNAAGQANWDFGPSPSAALSALDAAKTPTTFKISQLFVGHGRVVYRDARGGADKTLQIEQLTADADTAAAPIGLHAGGAWNGQHFEVSGVLGAMNVLMASGKPYPVKLKAVLPGLVATTNGTLSLGKGGVPQLSLQTTADATELAEAAKLAGYTLPPFGAVRIAMGMTGPLSSPSLVNIDAVLGRRDMLALTAKGSIKAPLTGEGVDLLLFAEGETLGGFSRSADLALPPVGPIRAAAHLTDFDGGWRLNDLKLSLGHSDVAGDMALGMRNPRPSVEAHLTSSLLDFGELTGGISDVPRVRTEAARIFSDEPLPLPLLNLADVSVGWKIDRLVSRGLSAHQVNLAVSDKGGKLLVTPAVAILAGGKASGSMSVDASIKVANVALSIDAEKVDMGELLKGFGVSQNVLGARSSLHMALKANGNSVRAMMARLSGDVSMVTDKGILDQGSADMVALDVLRQLAPWTQSKDTQMQCMVSRFSVVDGMAHSEALLFDTDAMTLSGQGSVNLANELLDLTVAPRPKDANLLSLAFPLDIGGTLAHPTVTPNRGAIVKGLAGVSSAAAAGVLGAQLPLANNAPGDDGNACLAALNQVKKAPPARKAGGKGPG
ncbi:MAG TPA: AsmA family protein [Telmatospirillum sp.]|nr:AsmA family protein [Telmatospirillum sp.]